ncbi:MAG: hypothetical protein MK104_07675 [Erythrobacter sp.]|jgi:hypothetical protein|uniref:hypothetical protein n=1 Tax=Qipengyuania pacifica TaxID=2860199 RepID=UPI0035C80C93|nr:hypothetical protein [Erythrobacter sp.]
MAGSPKKRARRERAAAAVDPLDEAAPRPPLAPIPFDGGQLTAEALEAIAAALSEGYPRHQIARALSTTVKTFERIVDGSEALLDAVEARKDAEEAELRDILMGMAKAGDTVAAIFLGKSQYGWRDRDDGKDRVVQGGGVLVVPGMESLDTWMARAEDQQKQFREAPVEVTDELAVREAEARRSGRPRRGTPGIEGLRLVKSNK